MTPDGKGVICDDPSTGKVVELAYDPTTVTLDGVTGLYDPTTKGFVALADAGNGLPQGTAAALAALQGFMPSTFFAVTVHEPARASPSAVIPAKAGIR
jgi:hypothetical protein